MRVELFLSMAVAAVLSAGFAYADIYVSEDFEQFAEGENIAEASGLWELTEPQDNPVGAGIASSKQAWSGKMSALFDDARCMGFPFANLELPESYAVSTWFYHDSTQAPPPDGIVTMIPDAYPGGGGNWIGIGTRTQAVETDNYTYRDKTGTGIYEDTEIPRRTDWVQLVFVVQPDATDLYVDGKKVYTVEIDATRYNGYQMSRTPPWGVQTGEIFIDDVIIADTLEEIPSTQAVSADGKLTTTWANMKAR